MDGRKKIKIILPISSSFFFSSRRRHTRYIGDWSSDVCSSDLANIELKKAVAAGRFGRLTLGETTCKWWREQSYYDLGGWKGTQALDGGGALMNQDRKSTRLNSSHRCISYAVFCLKQKNRDERS